MRHMDKHQRSRTIRGCGMLVAAGLLAGCAVSEDMAQTSEGGVESRGLAKMQRQMKPGMPMKPVAQAQPGAPAPADIKLPIWPQKWDVNNREPYGVAFGVTQPGPVPPALR